MRFLLIEAIGAAALLSGVAPPVGAFPGQTAEQMIGALGRPANGYVSPPLPAVDAVRAGEAQLSGVYWAQVAYDPLRSGAVLTGILVATFDYRSAGLAERLQQVPPEIGWKDLSSQSEVFLSFLSPQSFRQFLASLEAGWKIEAKGHHGAGPGYDLYSLTSRDGRQAGEISFTDKGAVAPPTGSNGQRPPTLNFWTKISAVR